jgi:hypothetical protein
MNTEERLKSMEGELRRIHRHNRWLLGVLLLFLVGLVAAGVLRITATPAQAQMAGAVKEIRARGFVLEDENGNGRAGLGVDKDGPALVLYGENGRMRATLSALKDGPALSFYDEQGHERAALTVLNGRPGFWLLDENGKRRVMLAAIKGSPNLVLSDEDGKPRAWLDVANNGSYLSLLDKKDQVRAGLAVIDDGPELVLSDENGKIRFVAGKTVIETPEGKTIEHPESSLILFGPDGKVIWSAIK